MIEEVANVEKQERKNRIKTRMLYILIAIDALVLGYAIYEIISLIISLSK